jgi:hypothetical protein
MSFQRPSAASVLIVAQLMIVSIRQLKEKCIEQNGALFQVFVDLTMAFDSRLCGLYFIN